MNLEIPSWLNKILLVATFLMMTTPYWTNINPVWGIVSAVAAGVLGSLGDGIKSFILPQGFTLTGLALVVAGVITYIVGQSGEGQVFSFISAKTIALLINIGPILTILGTKLKPQQVSPSFE